MLLDIGRNREVFGEKIRKGEFRGRRDRLRAKLSGRLVIAIAWCGHRFTDHRARRDP